MTPKETPIRHRRPPAQSRRTTPTHPEALPPGRYTTPWRHRRPARHGQGFHPGNWGRIWCGRRETEHPLRREDGAQASPSTTRSPRGCLGVYSFPNLLAPCLRNCPTLVTKRRPREETTRTGEAYGGSPRSRFGTAVGAGSASRSLRRPRTNHTATRDGQLPQRHPPASSTLPSRLGLPPRLSTLLAPRQDIRTSPPPSPMDAQQDWRAPEVAVGRGGVERGPMAARVRSP